MACTQPHPYPGDSWLGKANRLQFVEHSRRDQDVPKEGRVLAPVKNLAKTTGFKVGQAVLKAQRYIDALSQKKAQAVIGGRF